MNKGLICESTQGWGHIGSKSYGSLYSLRHTFATWFYDATKDLVALKEVLGHSDLRTVRRYVNDRQPRMDRAMERFDKVIVASSGTG